MSPSANARRGIWAAGPRRYHARKRQDGRLTLRRGFAGPLVACLFAFVLIGIFLQGAMLLFERNAMGLFLLGFSTLGALNVAWWLRKTRGARFDPKQKEVWLPELDDDRWPDGRMGFSEIAAVAILGETRDPHGLARVRLKLRGPGLDPIALDGPWPRWEATVLARSLAGIIGVAAQDDPAVGEPLTPIAPEEPWNASPPRGAVGPRLGTILSALVMGFGMIAFLGGFVASLARSRALQGVELPLGDAQGIAVDGEGRLYIASYSYRRVQRYGPRGTFDAGWPLPVGKGNIFLAIDRDERLDVAIGSGTFWTRYRMDEDQSLGMVTSSPPALRWGLRANADPAGNVYELHGSPARVLRRAPGSAPELVFRQSLWLFAVASPMPAFLWALLGICGLLFLDRRRAGARPRARRES